VTATWTITVAGDLSNITLTTDEPVVIVPIEERPIYLRGDMNMWEVSEDWRMNLLGKDSDGTAVYAFICGEDTQIMHYDQFKIADADWFKINIEPMGDTHVYMDLEMVAVNHGLNNINFYPEEDISGVIYLKMNYETNEGAIYVSNYKETPCPFPYEGYVVPDPFPTPNPEPTPDPEPVKVNVVVSDGTVFGYRVKLEEDTQFEVSLADEYWKISSYTYNGDLNKFDEPVSSVVISFAAGEKNDFEIQAEYCGTLEVMETSGVVDLSNNVTITVNEDSVEISGLEAGTSVAVYTLGGQTIMSRVASESVMTIRLDKGQTYIVRAGDAAVKVML
ncbi:MAG: hypothetical protein K2J70_00595, partial [Muribaculaceae bacterium]|nr:hypothetical protein [Muribaculaceae bacterium]